MTPEIWRASQVMRAQTRDYCTRVFEDVDLLITPTTPYTAPLARGPFPTQVGGVDCGPEVSGQFCMPFNYNWNPAASLRVAMSRAGMPIGLQVVGPNHCDDRVLQLCRAFEREQPWHPEWPVLR